MKPAPPEQAAQGAGCDTVGGPGHSLHGDGCGEVSQGAPRPPPRADHCLPTSSSSRCWEQEAPGQDSWLRPPRRLASPPGLTVNSSDRPGYF